MTILIDNRDPRERLLVSDRPSPLFSLRLGDDAMRILCFSVSVADQTGKAVWDSAPFQLPTLDIEYDGAELLPGTAYCVTAAITFSDGSSQTLEADFETGFLSSTWLAKWIEPEQEPAVREKRIKFDELFSPDADDGKVTERLRPARKLTKTFTCSAIPKRARLYASAHGIYEISINGALLGGALLAPEASAYSKRLYYQTYDPSALLRGGENTVEVLLGDGWWTGRIGLSGDSCQFGDTLGFIMQMDLIYPDGLEETLCSDGSFHGGRCHIDYADLFVGERHDYTLEPDAPLPCREVKYDMACLYAQPTDPVVILRELSPVFLTSPKGELIADFGQVVAGVADLETDSPPGTEITLDFCEVLDREGNYYRNIIGRYKNQTDIVICGNGITVFRPRFTYHGFRYVRITGTERERILALKAVVFGTRLEEIGEFVCSDARLNELQQNIRRSARSNMLSIPTDCPQREKMGWTGDILSFAPTAAFNYDVESFLSEWLCNLRFEQRPDGEVPNIAPSFPAQDEMDRERSGCNSSSAWGDACVLVPLTLYRRYGNIRVLRDNLDMMRRWLGFIERKAPGYLWTEGHHFGDWLIPSLRDKGHDGVMAGVEATYRVVGSCFYAVTVDAYIEVLQALGHNCEAESYYRLLDNIKEAVQKAYIDEDGHIDGDLQGLYVMALYAGIGGEELRGKMAFHLARLIRENGDRLDTGFVSVPYLLDVLVEHGYRDIAYKLLFQEKCPSWLYMVKNGATTIWENWAAIRPDGTPTDSSYNHCALGSVGDWLYRRAAGIEPAGPGYRTARFAPLFDIPLQSARASLSTPYGRFISCWTKSGQTLFWDITVPPNASGTAVLPDSEISLEAGAHHFEFSIYEEEIS